VGAVIVDEKGKLSGRGAYLCANLKCLEKARKTKALSRALKTEILNELYDRLQEYITTYRETHGEADVREIRALLGLSRRADLLYIGIDSVKSQCVKEPLLILTAADASESVQDAVRKRVDGGDGHVHVCAPIGGEIISAAIGAVNVQVVALPVQNGLADKIKMLLA
jgi:hypothetical protein